MDYDQRTVDPCQRTMHTGKRCVFVADRNGLMRIRNFDWALADGLAHAGYWNGNSNRVGQLVDNVAKLDFLAAVGSIFVETAH